MFTISENINSVQFINLLNDNFNDLAAMCVGSSIDVITSSNYISTINSNLANLVSLTHNVINPHIVTVGQKSSNFVSNLNIDFSLIEADFTNYPQVTPLTYKLLPTGYTYPVANGAIIYAVTNDKRIGKSVDYGITWTVSNKIFKDIVNSCFVSKDGILFVCSGQNVWRSGDDGVTWTLVFTTAIGNILQWGWTQNSTGVLFAGEYNLLSLNSIYVWRSTDDGINWTRLDGLYATGGVHVHQVFVDPETDRLYVTTGESKKTFYSDNNGDNWTEIFGALGLTGFTGITSLSGARYFATDVAAGGNKFRKSTDDAALTDLYTLPADYNYPYEIIIATHGTNKLFATSFNESQIAGKKAGIFKSVDAGANWTIEVSADTGSYQFTMPLKDYRNRIPSTLPYFITSTGGRMLRIGV